MEEKEHVLSILKKVKSSLYSKNYVKIKNLSDNVIHQAGMAQEPDIVFVAIIIYSLSKLIERESYKTEKNWEKFYKNYIKCLDNIIKSLEKDDLVEFHRQIDIITDIIENLSGNLKHYIEDVFRRARINKASRIYEHGISMEQTSKILGITIWELAEYAGRTRIGDVNLSVTMPIKKRIKLAEEIFK